MRLFINFENFAPELAISSFFVPLKYTLNCFWAFSFSAISPKSFISIFYYFKKYITFIQLLFLFFGANTRYTINFHWSFFIFIVCIFIFIFIIACFIKFFFTFFMAFMFMLMMFMFST